MQSFFVLKYESIAQELEIQITGSQERQASEDAKAFDVRFMSQPSRMKIRRFLCDETTVNSTFRIS